jgi:hypothetical protein
MPLAAAILLGALSSINWRILPSRLATVSTVNLTAPRIFTPRSFYAAMHVVTAPWAMYTYA